MDREFVAIDGEGIDRADGTHDYTLLCASDGTYTEEYAPGGLSSARCFEYLLELAAAHPGATFCIFGGSYDFQMMLRQACAPSAAHADRNWRALLADRYFTYRRPGRTYKIQAIMRHALYIAQGAYIHGAWRKQQAIRIWDVIGWFQSSFIDALDHYGVGRPGQRAHIRAMKEGRATFTPKQRGAIRLYSLAECRLLVELMESVAAVLDDRGIRPARWDGAGAGAASLMRRYKVDQHVARPDNPDLCDAIDRAYIGGRVQQFVSGVVPGPSYNYDLRGAYPHAMIELPCLIHGRWQRHDPQAAPVSQSGGARPARAKIPNRPLDRVISKWSLFRVRWSCPPGQRLTPLPYRHDGAIYWPRTGEGWYWSEEVAAAVECGYRIELVDRWSFVPGCDDQPFGWMADLYNERQMLKEKADPAERVLKLMQAAVYGKVVQSQREGRKMPAFQSYVWGGLTTAHVRAQVLRMAATCRASSDRYAGSSLVAIQTDGIFSTAALPVPDGWSAGAVEPGLLVIQPGVMLAPSAKFVRSRGFDRGSISYRKALGAWARDGFEASIPVKDRRFVSADWAEFTGHPEWWLTWREIPRALSFATIPRQWPRPGKVNPSPDGLYEELYPPEGWPELSAPYHARISEPASEDSAYEAMVLQQPEVVIDSGRI